MTPPTPRDAKITEREVERAREIAGDRYWDCVCGRAAGVGKPCTIHAEIAQALATARAEGVAEGQREEARKFRAMDHPHANGRAALPGEQGWTFTIPLEDGTTLAVSVGRLGRDAVIRMAHEEATDDLIDLAIRGGRDGA